MASKKRLMTGEEIAAEARLKFSSRKIRTCSAQGCSMTNERVPFVNGLCRVCITNKAVCKVEESHDESFGAFS